MGGRLEEKEEGAMLSNEGVALIEEKGSRERMKLFCRWRVGIEEGGKKKMLKEEGGVLRKGTLRQNRVWGWRKRKEKEKVNKKTEETKKNK